MGINTGIAKALAGMGRDLPGRLVSPNKFGAVPIPKDISKGAALGLTTGMGLGGGLGISDLTEGFTESAKLKNSIFANPEELGRQAARAKMSLEELMDKARQEAERIGQIPQIYFLQIQGGYQDEMNRQQEQEPKQIYDEDIEGGARPVSLFMAGGGEASFPDLTGDGQVTQADILKGRGVYATGGTPFDINVRNPENEKFAFEVLRGMQENINLPNELTAEQKQRFEHGLIMGGEEGIFMDAIKRMKSQGMNYEPSSNMTNIYTAQTNLTKSVPNFQDGGEAIGDELEGMEMSKEQAMAEVGNAEKEMQMIQQLVTVVQKLIAEGISEKDLIAFLKEQGLDDEDIDGLMQMVLQSQGSQDPEGIDQQIAGMM